MEVVNPAFFGGHKHLLKRGSFPDSEFSQLSEQRLVDPVRCRQAEPRAVVSQIVYRQDLAEPRATYRPPLQTNTFARP